MKSHGYSDFLGSYQIAMSAHGPVLSYQSAVPPSQTFVFDLQTKTLNYRLARVQQEPLIKACGLKQNQEILLVDATAGFGQDSLLLAQAGAQVIMIERLPILQEWLERVLNYLPDTYPELSTHLHLHKGDAKELLSQFKAVDIVYLDPMFPERKKSAKVQKRMAFLQMFPETLEEDMDHLFLLALKVATKRVVVKRPRLAPLINELKPSFSHTYRSCRFDVYLTPSHTVF